MAKHGPIILVDDDVEDQLLIREALEMSGNTHELKIFSNGEQVFEYLMHTTDKPFIIVCDINMPRMDGLSLRERINQTEYLRKKSIPFVFFSTTASRESIEKAYELTVQGFFVKPSTFDDLTRTLSMIISYWNVCKHPNKN
jgi:CheY-like chemotaxis protein